jgi:hypothetical protein
MIVRKKYQRSGGGEFCTSLLQPELTIQLQKREMLIHSRASKFQFSIVAEAREHHALVCRFWHSYLSHWMFLKHSTYNFPDTTSQRKELYVW